MLHVQMIEVKISMFFQFFERKALFEPDFSLLHFSSVATFINLTTKFNHGKCSRILS